MTRTIIRDKDTLYEIFRRVSDIYKKLQNNEPLSEKEKKELPLYLGIPKFKNKEDMKIKIEEFFDWVKQILKNQK